MSSLKESMYFKKRTPIEQRVSVLRIQDPITFYSTHLFACKLLMFFGSIYFNLSYFVLYHPKITHHFDQSPRILIYDFGKFQFIIITFKKNFGFLYQHICLFRVILITGEILFKTKLIKEIPRISRGSS